MNLALKSTPLVMIDAADYLNTKGEHDKAATLYMKGGKLSKAVEMCFNGKLFDVLQHIADDLQVCGVWVRVHTHSARFRSTAWGCGSVEEDELECTWSQGELQLARFRAMAAGAGRSRLGHVLLLAAFTAPLC